MELSENGIKLFCRLTNLCNEEKAITKKLERNKIPSGKADKLLYRLIDLQDRLIPKARSQVLGID
jgi:hypothetical protein